MPPLVGVAVKVTDVPAQKLVVFAAIKTVGVTLVVTDIVIVLEVAVVLVAQAELEVKTQVTVCPLVSVLVANVALFPPTLVPFTFH